MHTSSTAASKVVTSSFWRPNHAAIALSQRHTGGAGSGWREFANSLILFTPSRSKKYSYLVQGLGAMGIDGRLPLDRGIVGCLPCSSLSVSRSIISAQILRCLMLHDQSGESCPCCGSSAMGHDKVCCSPVWSWSQSGLAKAHGFSRPCR